MRSSELLGVHQALDHFEGFFFGVSARSLFVSVSRFSSNQCGTSLAVKVEVLNSSKKGMRSSHGVLSQFVAGAESMLNGAARVVAIAVWSEPVWGGGCLTYGSGA